MSGDYACPQPDCPRNLAGTCCWGHRTYLTSLVYRRFVVAYRGQEVLDDYPGPGWRPVFDRLAFVGWVEEGARSLRECRLEAARLSRREGRAAS